MDEHNLLEELPRLEEWYSQQSLVDADPNLMQLCQILNQPAGQSSFGQLGYFLSDLSQHGDSLEAIEDALLSIDLELAKILVPMIETALQNSHHEELYPAIVKVAERTANPSYCFLASWLALNIHRLEDCVAFAKWTEIRSPDYFGVLGQAYLEMEEFDNAIECFEKASEHQSMDPMPWFWLAKCYFAINRFADAWLAAKHCYQLVPDNIEASVLLALIADENVLDNQELVLTWQALWPHLNLINDQPMMVGIMFNLAFKLKSPDKLSQLIDRLDFDSLISKREFKGMIPHIMRNLAGEEWQEANFSFLSHFQKALA